MTGKVIHILIAESSNSPMIGHRMATLNAGKGIVGDRYYSDPLEKHQSHNREPDIEVTLIEQEHIDRFNQLTQLNYTGYDFRRNIVTKDIRLNDLVKKNFYIGNVHLKGIRLCEPCAYLSKQLGPEIMQHMVHKAGLRARILSSGKIFVDDVIAHPPVIS